MSALPLRNGVRGAVLIAAGVMLPMLFHAAGGAGAVFLPMHIPVLLAGLLFGPATGGIVGALTPICSSLLTGMPPLFPSLPAMVPELAVYGLTAGLLRPGNGVIIAMVMAMLAGRAAAGIVVLLLGQLVALPWTPWAYVTAAVLKGTPGIVVQLLFIPVVIKRLEGWINS
jgi:riboflavin transporter FmnP